ncbi:ring finger domain protein [Ophiostoma piceae UAMH 11346]|uniref:Ring finger domain protein n=1 Tax=Ophiostoma piceae (strain UAMH 11346) TaxID=1262450 RepID=S3CI34_OPHP1|nr:ring finger domain protein [Ophiostoma piceae UAMH 11346]
MYKGKNTVPSTIIKNLTAVSSDIAYSDHVTDNLTVLSSKSTETDNGILQGLLYVPDLDGDDPCQDQARDFVPNSAVHQNNLPSTNYNLVAIAPWFSKECTKSYLSSARYDPLRAFIFYLPSNDTTKPPGPNSDVWDLDDDGEWRTGNHFPIFAVSGALGSEMMYQLGLYSGNLTSVPFGDNISELYQPDPDDYVRIWTELTVSSPTGLPNVWVFILIVVGVLLAVVTFTFFGMHYVWRQRRASLRRRVVSGKINLEAMGIKRLTVPLYHLRKFPLFTYNYDPPLPSAIPHSPPLSQSTSIFSTPSPILPQASPSPSPSSILASRRLSQRRMSQPQQKHKSIDAAIVEDPVVIASDIRSQTTSDKESQSHISDPPSVVTVPASPTSIISEPEPSIAGDLDYQPMCHICLEPFQSRVTIIRELPCGHIFHTECIDEFLSYATAHPLQMQWSDMSELCTEYANG